uniref:Uncharacterized protein n=1 Tax=Daphnia galeata TaxID=27404 RepID=A0A8J2W4Y9_9CRUS|nr:unnamed protein product [Daphnia galeata]
MWSVRADMLSAEFHSESLKLLMLFLIRGIASGYQFKLGTEMPKVGGKFDDLIFKYEIEKADGTNAKTERYRFLQAKHKQNEETGKITATDLRNNSGDYSLSKYFRSYCREIKKHCKAENVRDCIICTNIGFGDEEAITKLGKDGFQLIPYNDPRNDPDNILVFDPIRNKESGITIKTPVRYKLENTDKLRQEMKKWSEKYHLVLVNEWGVIERQKKNKEFSGKLSKKFIDGTNLNGNSKKSFKISASFVTKNQSPDKTKESLDCATRDEDIRHFLDNLVFAVHTPNEVELDDVMKSEVGNHYGLHEIDFQSDFILRKMLNWFKKKESTFMSSEEGTNIFKEGEEKMKSLRVTGISIDYQKQLKKVLEFNEEAIGEMKGKLERMDYSLEFSHISKCSPPELSEYLASKGFDNSTCCKLSEVQKLINHMKDVSLPTLANTREESVNHQESGTSDVESVETVQQFISSIESGSVQVDETILVIQDSSEKNDLMSNANPVNETASTTEETPISDDGRVGQPLINPSSNTTSLSSSDPSPFGACPSNDIGQIDVIQLLEKNDSGKELIAKYRTREPPYIKDFEREEIVRIVVATIVSLIGHLYPSTETKEQMGASITRAFTCLKITRPGVTNYCHFYNKKTGGFIDTRLKTLRKSQSPSKRKRCTPKKPGKGKDTGSKRQKEASVGEIDESSLYKIRWLQTHPSYPQNRTEILQYMRETFECRQKLINTELTSATLILERFPRLADFENGFLIIGDFLHQFPSSGAFEEQFMFKLSGKIEQLATIEKVQLPVRCSDRCITTLMMCLLLFPAIRRIKRESQSTLLERFIVFQSENFDVEEFFKY